MRGASGNVRSPFVANYDCLTFLTDYGVEDGFVAACHGVAARISPGIRLIDITHLVPPGDVRRGAAVGGAQRACQLTNGEWWLHPVSPTFHGRDIFTPVAARLATGHDLAGAGTEIDVADLVTLPAPTSRVHDGEAEGEVMSVDRFGNVQLSIAASDADRLGIGFGSPVVVRCGRRQLTVPYLETFAAVAPGEIVAFTDSAGLISLAVNGGDAAEQLGLPPGAHVRLSAAMPA